MARPWAILVMLSVVTAVFSALLDNVTTVLLIAPVTLLITDELEVSPYPFLVAEIFASNIGGTATLIGDPPNIMIGSAVRLTFNDFMIQPRADHPPDPGGDADGVLLHLRPRNAEPATSVARTSCASGSARRSPTCPC